MCVCVCICVYFNEDNNFTYIDILYRSIQILYNSLTY